MIIPSAIQCLYESAAPLVKELRERVRPVLLKFCETKDFIFDDRIKSVESLAEKIESGRFRAWSEIDDLYACTIAVPTANQEKEVVEYLVDRFVRVDMRDRTNNAKQPDVFRFDSIRFIGKLQPPDESIPAIMTTIYGLRFEVQVKTLFEYAWSRTTHALTYKGENINWERLRLVAQLKAAVEQLDILIVAFENVSAAVSPAGCADVSDKARIEAFFKKQFLNSRIPSESKPKDWSRFCDNVYRCIQALNGERASGRSARPIERLDHCFLLVERYLSQITLDKFPRSLSLFQVIVHVLADSGDFLRRRNDYYILWGDDAESIFPTSNLPGSVFEFE